MMNTDHCTDRDHSYTAGPPPAPVYLPTDHPCEHCGEDAPIDEHDECEACVNARREHDNLA